MTHHLVLTSQTQHQTKIRPRVLSSPFILVLFPVNIFGAINNCRGGAQRGRSAPHYHQTCLRAWGSSFVKEQEPLPLSRSTPPCSLPPLWLTRIIRVTTAALYQPVTFEV